MSTGLMMGLSPMTAFKRPQARLRHGGFLRQIDHRAQRGAVAERQPHPAADAHLARQLGGNEVVELPVRRTVHDDAGETLGRLHGGKLRSETAPPYQTCGAE